MKKLVFASLILMLLAAAMPAGAFASAITDPYSGSVSLAGEEITTHCDGRTLLITSGMEHFAGQEIYIAPGKFQLIWQSNLQGVAVVDEETGTQYRLTGTDRWVGNGLTPNEINTIDLRYHLIGEGTETDETVIETFHATINANGELTALRHELSVECR